MTRIAVPVISYDGLSSKVFEHFGRSDIFAVLEVDGGVITTVDVIRNEPSNEGQKKPSAFIIENHVEVVLAGLIGPCEYGVLLDNAVRVFKGAEGTAMDAYESYKAGKLTEVQKPRYCL